MTEPASSPAKTTAAATAPAPRTASGPALPDLPQIPGVTLMTALEMNSVHFARKHTVLTPAQLDAMAAAASTRKG